MLAGLIQARKGAPRFLYPHTNNEHSHCAKIDMAARDFLHPWSDLWSRHS